MASSRWRYPRPAQAELVGYWTFDTDVASSGGAVLNSVDPTYNGFQVGPVAFSSDTPAALAGGQSLDLTNTSADTYVVISNSSETQTGAYGSTNQWDGRFDNAFGSGYTISAWIKGLPNDGWEPFISAKGEDHNGYQLRRFGGDPTLGTTNRLFEPGDQPTNFDGDDVNSGVDISDNQWRQATFFWNGVQQQLFIDGTRVFSSDHIPLPDTGAGAGGFGAPTWEFLVFGGRDNGGLSASSHIQLDDVAIFSHSLAPKQSRLMGQGAFTGSLGTLPSFAGSDFTQDGQFHIRTVYNNGTLSDLYSAVVSYDSGGGIINNGNVTTLDFGETGDNGHAGGSQPFPGTPFGQDHMVMLATGKFEIQSAGTYTIYAKGDDGFSLRVVGEDFTSVTTGGDGTARISGDTMFNEVAGGNVTGFGVIDLAAGVHDLEYLFFEVAGGEYAEVWIAPGTHTAWNVNDFSLLTAAAPVPEPTSVALVLLGLPALLFAVRRRRR